MTDESVKNRESAILERADKIDNLVSAFIAELKVHVDLLRDEVETQERSR